MVCIFAALSLATGCVLFAVALTDLRTLRIPNALNLALVPIAVLWALVCPEVGLLTRAIGIFCVSVPMLLLNFAVRGAFGGGDIKLMMVCGFLLGWQSALVAFGLALLTGGGYAALLLLTKKAKLGSAARIAFGPHLCFGVAVGLFCGAEIARRYVEILRL